MGLQNHVIHFLQVVVKPFLTDSFQFCEMGKIFRSCDPERMQIIGCGQWSFQIRFFPNKSLDIAMTFLPKLQGKIAIENMQFRHDAHTFLT
jgi:hypothetical protein